jgi:hypothetical protein
MESYNAHPIVPLFAGIFALMVFFFVVLLTAVMVWVYCRIFSKAGYSWALGLLMIVPIANIVMPFVLAFGDWPIHKELRQLKGQQNSAMR